MSIPKSPFAPSSSSPGVGRVTVSLLPPQKQILTAFTYQYPLKLIAPDPHLSGDTPHHAVSVVFLLTYGGGLVGGDKINLSVSLEENTHLVLATQGSTKIFKSPTRAVVSAQMLRVTVANGASLCYLPDPTQPFGESVYEQKQTFLVGPQASSLCVLDWICEGRRARGESWKLWSWKGRNEVREMSQDAEGQSQLLLRDAVMLSDESTGSDSFGASLQDKTNNMGVFGTLILYGPTFNALGDFFMREFTSQPRIGAKNWSTENGVIELSEEQRRREGRLFEEKNNGLLWTAASTRGFMLVKFGAREVDGARKWLRDMIRQEGTVEKEFGHQAMISMR